MCYDVLQVTPGLGVLAAVMMLLLVKEPKRGGADGHRSRDGVKGKHGVLAYFKDLWYLLLK